MIRRTLVAFVSLLAVGATASGCGFTGLNSYPLPFTKGSGENAITVTVRMNNAGSLVPNSEVKVNNVTVGSVRDIEFANWHATLTVGLEPDVRLPANAVARIGQKSLLGAKYLQLSPPKNAKPSGRLTDGAVIPMARTGRYPTTEELLGAASILLGGGGLQHLKTITTELNNALSGRETDVRGLISKIDTLTSSLNSQRDDLVRALEQMERLAGTLSAQKQTLAHGLETIPRGLRVLNEEHGELMNTLTAIADFSDVADRVLNGSREKLVANLRDLRPALRELADTGRKLPRLLRSVTYPFSVEALTDAIRGDYMNFFAQLNLTLPALDRNFLSGTPLEGLLIGASGLLTGGTGTESVNPLRAPTQLPEPQPPEKAQTPGETGSPEGSGESGTPEKPAGSPSSRPTPQAPEEGSGGLLGGLLNPAGRGDG